MASKTLSPRKRISSHFLSSGNLMDTMPPDRRAHNSKNTLHLFLLHKFRHNAFLLSESARPPTRSSIHGTQFAPNGRRVCLYIVLTCKNKHNLSNISLHFSLLHGKNKSGQKGIHPFCLACTVAGAMVGSASSASIIRCLASAEAFSQKWPRARNVLARL